MITIESDNTKTSWKKEYAPEHVRDADNLDAPQKQDIEITAETTAFVAADLQDVAEVLVFALERISQLQQEVEELKNG